VVGRVHVKTYDIVYFLLELGVARDLEVFTRCGSRPFSLRMSRTVTCAIPPGFAANVRSGRWLARRGGGDIAISPGFPRLSPEVFGPPGGRVAS